MLDIKINEEELKQMCIEEIQKKLQEIDIEKVFWDVHELKRRTCLSWNNILDKFFYDSRFKKFKVGGKWLFPAKETQRFLLEWLSEQSRS